MNTYDLPLLLTASRRHAWDDAAANIVYRHVDEIISRVFISTQTPTRTHLSAADRESILRAYEAAYNDNL